MLAMAGVNIRHRQQQEKYMGTYPESWTVGCPPADAVDAQGEYFRVVKEDPCAANDFQTQGELGRAINGCACLRVGLSLLTDYESASHYRDKFPYLGERIAAAKLSPPHGKTKAGNGGHVTWWSYSVVSRHTLFSVVG